MRVVPEDASQEILLLLVSRFAQYVETKRVKSYYQ
jgi:hypothetical protein